MRISFCPLIILAVVLAGCGSPSPEEIRAESARLRGSFDKHRSDYMDAIEAANKLTPETIAWLDGAAITASRAQAVADTHMIMNKWAAAHFGPRYMHEQLRFDKYSAPEVVAVQKRMLDHLKRIYVEYHDYQRYAQHAADTSMHGMPAGRLPPQLQEFRRRLMERKPTADEITPLLDSLPK